MSPRPAGLALLLAAVGACASNPPPRPTRVDREQRVRADNDLRDRWFATLYSLQRLLATAQERRIDVFGPLQVMLCLPSDASLSRLAAVAQARMENTGVVRARTRLRRTVDSEQALNRWIEASNLSPGALVERESLIALEETLVVERSTPTGAQPLDLRPADAPIREPRCEPGATEGSQGSDGPVVLAQLAIVLRRSAAHALMFQRAVSLAGELRTLFPAVSQGASGALAAEFRAADRALVGVLARATMHLHESARAEQWALGLLTPEGQTPPEEVPDVQPEDNDPGDRVPERPGATETMPVNPAPAPGAPSPGASPGTAPGNAQKPSQAPGP